MRTKIKEKLTPRELTVLKMLAEGVGNSEIGKSIHVSIHTVKVHISSIIRKLNAKNRTNAAYIAAINKFFDE